MLRTFVFCLLAAVLCHAADPGAAALARAARQAQSSGLVVRAYMLYAEAAARDPQNESYRMNRDALAPLAKLLSKAHIEEAPSRVDLLANVDRAGDSDLDQTPASTPNWNPAMRPPPALTPEPGRHDFHLRGDERTLFDAVAKAYGVSVVFDPQFEPRAGQRVDMDDAGFRAAMRGLTDATDTFVFPISAHAIFVARDTPQKRDDYEPLVAFTVPLPDVNDPKQISDVVNGIRQLLQLKHIGFDSEQRAIVIRARLSDALVARSLLESLIRPKAQVAIEVQILRLDSQSDVHYGLTLPTSFPLVDFGRLLNFQSLANVPQGFTSFFSFGGGATLFGIGITEATAFATASQSRSTSLYDATVTASSGQTASLHVGDRYPIAQTLFNGASAAANALYQPPSAVQLVDLGVLLKITPRVGDEGDVSLDIEASFKALGSQSINDVPEILQREFSSSVRLKEGEWAVLGGLESQSNTATRNGIAGLSQLPVAGALFGDLNRSQAASQTLVVLKPHLLRDEDFSESPRYFVGGDYGRKVLL